MTDGVNQTTAGFTDAQIEAAAKAAVRECAPEESRESIEYHWKWCSPSLQEDWRRIALAALRAAEALAWRPIGELHGQIGEYFIERGDGRVGPWHTLGGIPSDAVRWRPLPAPPGADDGR